MIILRIHEPQNLPETDRSFLTAFHQRTLERFSHRDHLRLAWILIIGHGLNEGSKMLKRGIREFAEDQGSGNRYHETLTSFWSRLINHAIQVSPGVKDFDALLTSLPVLMDKCLPSRHWSDSVLWSDSARAGWVEPDLQPLTF